MQCVFSPPNLWLPLTPTNHLYAIICGTGEKLTKMVGNSASKLLKRIELRTLYKKTNYRLMENCADEAPRILEIYIDISKR